MPCSCIFITYAENLTVCVKVSQATSQATHFQQAILHPLLKAVKCNIKFILPVWHIFKIHLHPIQSAILSNRIHFKFKINCNISQFFSFIFEHMNITVMSRKPLIPCPQQHGCRANTLQSLQWLVKWRNWYPYLLLFLQLKFIQPLHNIFISTFVFLTEPLIEWAFWLQCRRCCFRWHFFSNSTIFPGYTLFMFLCEMKT